MSELAAAAQPVGPLSVVEPAASAGSRNAYSDWRAIRWLDGGIEVIVSGALIIELVILFANVVTRNAFGFSLIWAPELAELALAIMAFLGGAIAFRRGDQLAVVAVLQRLPRPVRMVVAAISNWLVILMAVVVTWIAVPVVLNQAGGHTAVLNLSLALYSAPLPVGMALLTLYASLALLRDRSVHTLMGAAAVLVVSGLAYAAVVLLQPSDSATALILAVVLALVLLLSGLPIAFVFGLAAITYLTFSASVLQLPSIVITMNDAVAKVLFLPVPFFILAGFLMTAGGLSQMIVRLAQAIVGRLPGALWQVSIVSTFLFSGLSGSKIADIAAVGATLNPAMRKAGYNPAETAAVLAASAVMGETIPPSIAVLVLGSITSLSIGALFIAGILPAVLIGACLMVTVHLRAKRLGQAGGAPTSWREIRAASTGGLPALLVPVILLGGIISGIGTPTEVSSFAVLYALVVVLITQRTLDLRRYRRMVSEAAVFAGMILMILATATAFTWSLTIAQVPDLITGLVFAMGGSKIFFLLLTIVLMSVVGMLFEGLPALLIFAPLFLPIAVGLGIDPIQYGIVLLIAMGLGAFAPPLGVGLFIACSICDTTVERAIPRTLPYFATLYVGLLIVAFVPAVSLVLPHAFGIGR